MKRVSTYPEVFKTISVKRIPSSVLIDMGSYPSLRSEKKRMNRA